MRALIPALILSLVACDASITPPVSPAAPKADAIAEASSDVADATAGGDDDLVGRSTDAGLSADVDSADADWGGDDDFREFGPDLYPEPGPEPMPEPGPEPEPEAEPEVESDAQPDPDTWVYPDAPALYPPDRTQSPISAALADSLRALVAVDPGLDARVFAKIGDSISTGSNFMGCYADPSLWDLQDYGDPLAPMIDWYGVDLPGGGTPFDRDSLATQVGMGAPWATEGDPSPLVAEVEAIGPRFAVVMMGTNDLSYGGTPTALRQRFWRYYTDHMRLILDALLERGIVPLLTAIPPREDHPTRAALTPTLNALLRGLAWHRGVPFIDFYRELWMLPDHGLGGDGVHPTYTWQSACWFDDAGLALGHNVRNLITGQALERMRQVFVDEAAGLEGPDELEPLLGEGSAEAPFAVPFVPFGVGGEGGAATTPCGAGEVYRLDLSEATPLRIVATAPGGEAACAGDFWTCDGSEDLLVGLVGADGTCVATDPTMLEATLAAGVWDIVVSSSGEYVLGIARCFDDDSACAP